SSATVQNASTLLFTDANEAVTISGGTATATSDRYTHTCTPATNLAPTLNAAANNAAVTSGSTAEPVNVDTISTSQTPAIASVGQSISDSATVTALVSPDSFPTRRSSDLSSATVQNASTLLFTDANEAVTISGGTATAT